MWWRPAVKTKGHHCNTAKRWISKWTAPGGLLVYRYKHRGYHTLSRPARLVAGRNSSTAEGCCFSLLQEFQPGGSEPCWSWRGVNAGMSGAIDCLSTKGRKAAVGFSTVSSRKWDQTNSQAARPAITSLGGQEISSDPPFYDPQLSASGRLEGMEVGQDRRRRRRGCGGERPENVTSLGSTSGSRATGSSCEWI